MTGVSPHPDKAPLMLSGKYRESEEEKNLLLAVRPAGSSEC